MKDGVLWAPFFFGSGHKKSGALSEAPLNPNTNRVIGKQFYAWLALIKRSSALPAAW